jgi:hypothetical protein
MALMRITLNPIYRDIDLDKFSMQAPGASTCTIRSVWQYVQKGLLALKLALCAPCGNTCKDYESRVIFRGVIAATLFLCTQ